MAITVRAVDYAFVPASITVQSGASVTVTLRNDDGAEEHDLAVRIPAQFKTDACGGPCTSSVTFTAPGPGTYPMICTIHSDMLGSVIVR